MKTHVDEIAFGLIAAAEIDLPAFVEYNDFVKNL